MNRAELRKRLWRLISDEGIIVTNDNLDWLLERVYKEHEAEQTAVGRGMRRYIDADELYRETEKKIKAANEYRMAVVDGEFLDLINDAPTEEDVVEVVRCKDCKHGQAQRRLGVICEYEQDKIRAYNSFCSYGERREG